MLDDNSADLHFSDDSYGDEVLERLDDSCGDSGDDEPMMVGSDDQFSNRELETEGTTPLIVIKVGVFHYFIAS